MPTWLTHLWEFMAANSMVINDGVPDLMLEREGDKFFIREFQAAGYSGNSLKRLNLCRLFLHAVTVSDIATGCSCFITQAAWQGRKDDTRASRYEWPYQGCPAETDWVLWRDALIRALCSRQWVLRQQLGHWLHAGPALWFYDEQSERLFQIADTTTLMYPRVPGGAS